ncbi:unnamed protein product [Effrenium voratum]|nr:unnamed protein product [Effrenium voratum]
MKRKPVEEPPDAAERRKAKPVVAYRVDLLPEFDASFYSRVRDGLTKTHEVLVPPREARSFEVRKGQVFRIRCTGGPQVGDLNLWCLDKLEERFYTGKTRQLHATHLTKGDRLWSCFPFLRPMATITHDTLEWYGWDEDGASVHDVIGTRCDPYSNKVLRGEDYDHCCHSNLIRALSERGVEDAEKHVHDVLNVFMCTGFTKDTHQYFMKASPVRVGDYIEFFAERVWRSPQDRQMLGAPLIGNHAADRSDERRRMSLDKPLLERRTMRLTPCAAHAGGLLLIVLVAFIWVGASQLIETIFKDQSFDHPYFLTYFNTCGFSFWLLGTACRKPVECEGQEVLNDELPPRCPQLLKFGRIAMVIAPAWLLANYLFNLSLDYTSVASNSMFSTTSNIWTMLFSVCFLGERINPFHVIAVVLTMTGSILVATADAKASTAETSSWIGDGLALVSAFVYGAYTVLLKYHVPEQEEALAMPTLFGCIGVLVLTFGWPILIFFHLLSWEEFAWPSRAVLGSLTVNALIGTNLSDVLWAYALQLTTPLTATLGLSLTVPFGMISDVVLRGRSFGLQYISGSLLVLVGFLLVSFAPQMWSRLRINTCETSEA